MRTNFVSAILFVLCGIAATFAQESFSGEHKFKGTVKDGSGFVIAGLNLNLTKDGSSFVYTTDINGEFEIELRPGEYEITLNETFSKSFKSSVRISGKGSTKRDFIIDTSEACCIDPHGVPFPKIVSLPKLTFPAAAKALNAGGEVVVLAKIRNDGTVISATAQSGHPLLRPNALATARSVVFETANPSDERSAILTFVYFPNVKNEIKGLWRYSNPFRIEIR